MLKLINDLILITMNDLFTFFDGVLYYKNIPVTHNGETFKGSLIALIFDENYCFVKSSADTIDEIINDYMECTGKDDFNVQILTLNL